MDESLKDILNACDTAYSKMGVSKSAVLVEGDQVSHVRDLGKSFAEQDGLKCSFEVE